MPKFVIESKDSSGNPVPVMGFILGWNYEKPEYDRNKVIDAWRINNLPTKLLEGACDRISAVGRALNKCKEKNLLREIDTNRYQMTETFETQLMSGANALGYKVKEIIVYDDVNETFTFEDADGRSYSNDLKAKDLLDKVTHCESVFTNADLTRYSKAAFKKTGFHALSKKGCFYFIPARFKDMVMSMKAAFEMTEPEGFFTLIDVPDTANSRMSVSDSAVDMFKGKLKAFRDKIAENKGNSKDGKVSRRQFGFCQKDIAELAGDIELIVECTQYDLNDAKRELDAFKNQLDIEMGIVPDPNAPAPEAPVEEELDVNASFNPEPAPTGQSTASDDDLPVSFN